LAYLSVVGVGHGLDGRDAAMQAARQALDELGTLQPVLALVFAAEEFEPSEVLAGLTSMLGDTPLWGMSTVRALAGEREEPRAVVVMVIAGNDLKAAVHWWPGYGADSQEAARQAVRTLRSDLVLPQGALVAADGVQGNLLPLCAALADLPTRIGGCLASGGYALGKTPLFARAQTAPGALAIAALGGRFRLSVGYGHGWRDSGLQVRFGKTHDVWVDAINDVSPADFYAEIFGRPAREWAYPPLNELVRLYPFGLQEYPGSPDYILRSPLRVEVNGSLRMNVPIEAGTTARLTLGDPQACLLAVEQAARKALSDLAPASPMAALAFVDVAWLSLFGIQAGQIPLALREALGSIPLAGAYTLGQVAQPVAGAAPRLFNQNIQILLLGYQA